jgi:hypothetical protein
MLGMLRVSKIELLLMIMQGRNTCAKEDPQSSDLSHVSICSVCRALTIFCDYPNPKPLSTEVIVRYPAVKAAAMATTAMLNEGKPSPMTTSFLCFLCERFLRLTARSSL